MGAFAIAKQVLDFAEFVRGESVAIWGVRRGFTFCRHSGEPVKTGIDHPIEQSNLDLAESNCYFGSAQRSSVFDQLRNCYEMRVVGRDRILEAYYKASIPDDGEISVGRPPPAAR
jgi:hypothetical protein